MIQQHQASVILNPVVPGEARIYYCGATVQGEPHVGHIRSALVFDQLARWMHYRGFKVTTVRKCLRILTIKFGEVR